MSWLTLPHAAFHTLRISLPTVLQAARGTLTPDACDQRLALWSRELLQFARVELDVSGREHGATGEAFVVMSNHQSHYDIPVLLQALNRRLRMVAKAELFQIPIWGPAMRAAGMVEVDRKNREAAIESLQRAREALASGISIWIAPEGTRSTSGELGEFKKGGFHLAVDTGARILPVSIDGTRRVLPAKGRSVRGGQHVRVTIHAPVGVIPSDEAQLDHLVANVRAAIASAVKGPND